ncbi:MAG: hypothetical protein LBF41_08670 [Deltaproteobacteria bacterium]|jgi:hypothetical protein|nr:hypothetical protein [Deltaproteobacteria bacterium]
MPHQNTVDAINDETGGYFTEISHLLYYDRPFDRLGRVLSRASCLMEVPLHYRLEELHRIYRGEGWEHKRALSRSLEDMVTHLAEVRTFYEAVLGVYDLMDRAFEHWEETRDWLLSLGRPPTFRELNEELGFKTKTEEDAETMKESYLRYYRELDEHHSKTRDLLNGAFATLDAEDVPEGERRGSLGNLRAKLARTKPPVHPYD